MSTTFSSSLYLLIALAFLLQTALGANPLHHICSSSVNTTNNVAYVANLNKLIRYLNIQTPRNGFSNATIGQKPNHVNGLALCRGDITSSDCKTCINKASIEIRKRCPVSNNKGAIIWYDYCQLKYSDTDFLGQIDNHNKFSTHSVRTVSDPQLFNQKIKELFSEIAEETPEETELFEDEDIKIGENKKLYGMGQCTRDLSSGDCKKCLDGIIGELPRCCDGKEGGRVVAGSCNVRYEIYPFIHDDDD